ncbi:MAG: PKD domain-containing protein [Chitinophagaceae bacterium]|nr:PKD domain-containing protein [Chitinophagaceae bacterium]
MVKSAYIRLREPEVRINVPDGGCVPFSFQPVATIDSNDPIVSYSWNLGAPGAIFNVQNPPPYTYTTPGNYDISLTITTESGCTKTVTVPNGIRTGTEPTASFTVQPLEACASDTFQFTNNSVITPGAEIIWHWDFGDGGTSGDFSPTHVFQDTGRLFVVLTVSNNRCRASDTVDVLVRPPVALFNYDVNCVNNQVTFTNQSLVDPTLTPLTWLWEMGDASNTQYDTETPPPFTYPVPGSYPVRLTVTNGSCSYTTTQTIRLLDEQANFTVSDASICPGDQIELTATGSDADVIEWYAWSINGVAQSDSSRTISFRPPSMGTYHVTLTISDLNGCTSTRTINNAFSVNGPEARFTITQNGDCSNRTFTFNDQSTSTTPIANWRFIFGDGTTQNFSAPPFTHTYASTGAYNVRMIITDQGGCESSYALPTPLLVSSPRAGFRADTFYCPGAPISFIDTSAGVALNYFWDFGDGNTSTLANPQHAYADGDADYTVKLVVTDINGCQDSVIRPAYIKIRSPKAAFSIRDTTSICPPLRTSFTFEGADYDSFYWDFGDGGMSTQMNPTNFYGFAGTFTPKLYLMGRGGCIDSAQSSVTVHNIADVRLDYGPELRACNSLNVDFNLTVPPGFKFILYFGDGTADSSRQTVLSHFYSKPSFSRPYIVIYDSISGCQSTITGANRIEVLGAIPLFGIDRDEFCDQGEVVFTDFTTRNEPIISTTWTFGDGSTSGEQSPTHNFTTPGTYIVRLDVTTQSNCSSFYEDTVLVYRTPEPIISARDTICVNQSELFGGTIAVPDSLTHWNWSFGNGRTATTQDGITTYSIPGDYTVRLITSNEIGCADTTTRTVYVSPSPTATPVQDPITIIAGASTPLTMNYTGNLASYSWTPEYRLSCFNCPEPIATPSCEHALRCESRNRSWLSGQRLYYGKCRLQQLQLFYPKYILTQW